MFEPKTDKREKILGIGIYADSADPGVGGAGMLAGQLGTDA